MIKSFFAKLKTEHYVLAVILIITVLLRFPGLGYSHFYGDETKTLYWDKTVPAQEFFFSQRKGPVQFFVVWGVETITGGFNEAAVRLPFAVAGTLAVFAFYLLLKTWFNKRIGYIGVFLFSINGFFIAFSRTAQYQSFLWLFGFLAVLFAMYAVKKESREKLYLLLSGGFLGLAFLTHYDAIFYAIPVAFVLGTAWFKDGKFIFRKNHLFYFAIPTLLIASTFYIPYIIHGYFENQTLGYLNRRLEGAKVISSSLQTYWIYNPSLFHFAILGFAPLFLFSRYRPQAVILDLWFTAPMILFEIVFSNPGTHIQNYVIPMMAMTGVGLDLVLEKLWKNRIKYVLGALLVIVFTANAMGMFKIYLPYFNADYPWKKSNLGNLEYSLFLYGFPYNRGWDEIGNYLHEVGAHSFYTSDNVTIGKYYALGIFSDRVEPEYLVHVFENQEFRTLNKDFTEEVFGNYTYMLEKDIFVDGTQTAQIFKRIEN